MTLPLFRPSAALLLAIIAAPVAPAMAQTVPDAAAAAEGSGSVNGSLPAIGASGVSTPQVFVSAIADGAVSAPSLGQSEAEVAAAKAEDEAAAEAAVAEAEAAAKAAAEGGVAEDGAAGDAPNEPVVTEDGSIALVPADATEPRSPFLRIGAEAAPVDPVEPVEVPAVEPPFEPVPIVEQIRDAIVICIELDVRTGEATLPASPMQDINRLLEQNKSISLNIDETYSRLPR